jgi:hypothetical protein
MNLTKQTRWLSSYFVALILVCILPVFSASALAMDTDSDGIEDTIEQTITGTDYRDPDTDNDGLLDGAEDLDRDGVRDVMETSPKDADSDDDGLSDGEEDLDKDGVFDITETHPLDSDSDDDLLNDGLEKGRTIGIASGTSSPGGIAYFGTYPTWTGDADPATKTDPRDADTDNDGILDGNEDRDRDGVRDFSETSPLDADTDDDGLGDWQEDLDKDGVVDAAETNPLDSDSDDDLLNDGLEKGRTTGIAGGTSSPGGIVYYGTYLASWTPDADSATTTDPRDADTDNDGLLDGDEDFNHNGRVDAGESNPNVDDDADGDGFYSIASGGTDCDDTNPAINPAATDIPCNGVDEDCDGMDAGEDNDWDGYCSAASGGNDCDDTNSAIHPGAVEIWYDGIDQNCDGYNDYDMDNDGYVSELWPDKVGGTATHTGDCDDTNSAIHPGAVEIAWDDVDSNCDGMEAPDNDGDGFDSTVDCDDTNPAINPEGTDIACNGLDEDCDGMDAEGTDADGDGHCSIASGGDDCDDANPAVHPGAVDIPGNGIDEDCDGHDAVIPCDYTLAGDWNTDCKVDLEDLAVIAANWLVNCFEDRENPACVHH